MKFSPFQKLKLSLLVLTITILLGPNISMAAPSTLVIDEFQIAGDSSYDEYLVIANYGEKAVNLEGYKIVKYTAAGNPSTIFSAFGTSSLETNKKLMICHNSFQGTRLPKTFVYNPSSSTYTMAANNSIALINSTGGVVDLVGHGVYGDAPVKYYEGEAISTSPTAHETLVRQNGLDSDNNRMDFQLYAEPIVVDVNADKLVISELLPNPKDGSEWFELYNPTNLDISLGNLKICDAMGSTHCYFFDKSDFIPAGKYKTYAQSVTKITLNNTGDWLELYDIADNLIADSGGNYGATDKGVSLALFGSEYRWTTTLTPGTQNVFTDIVEIEEDQAPKAKTSKSKVATKKKTVVKASIASDTSEEPTEEDAEVKGAESKNSVSAVQKAFIDRKTIGWALIGLAILLVLGYICWYFRDYAKNIYHKIRPRDDSTRF